MNTVHRQKNQNVSSRNWIKYTKRQPCAPMYGRLYHYAENNPVRYIDPDGRTVYVYGTSKEEKILLNALNKYSYSQYKVNDEGYLEKTDEINEQGSIIYSDAIDRCIADENTEIGLLFSKKGREELWGQPVDVKKRYGGACTLFNLYEEDPSEIFIYVMKKGRWNAPIERLLMHEIVGHADPISAGGSRNDENAVENENRVLEDLQMTDQMRDEEPWHTAR